MIYEARRSITLNELKPLDQVGIEIFKDVGDLSDFHRINNSVIPYVYLNQKLGIFCCAYIVSVMKEALDIKSEIYSKLLNVGDYRSIIDYSDNQFALATFELLMDIIPEDKLYETFIRAYCKSDYNLENALKNIKVKDIISKKRLSDEQKLSVIDGCEEFVGDKIKIYRAQGSMSIPLEDAISWTLDYSVAKHFAKECNTSRDGVIYEAYVSLNNITDYINKRENEIIVDYKYIENLNKIG